MSTHWLKRYYQELSYDKGYNKWIDEANNTKLRKSTGSIRTQYPIERVVLLFDYEMKIHKAMGKAVLFSKSCRRMGRGEN